MKKELKIEVPQGYEIDRQKSTFEKIIFKKIPETPKTWEEYCRLNCLKDSFTPVYGNCSAECSHTGSYDEFYTKERAEQFIALGQLMQLRDYWVRGYKKTEEEYVIYITCQGNIRVTTWHNKFMKKLTFPTEDMANDFINCFRDLIKTAYMR